MKNAQTALEKAIQNWNYVRSLTYLYIRHMPGSALAKRLPRPALNKIGKHFLEMADVTTAYARGITTGVVDFGHVRWVFPPDQVKSKEKIVAQLRKSDGLLRRAIRAASQKPDRTYKMGEEEMSLLDLVTWLTLHEILHHGQMIAFGYQLKTGFPDAWIQQWALPPDD